MIIPITALFAGILGVLYFRVSLKAIFARSDAKVWSGTGTEDSKLARRIRAHANFAEYIPFLLIMMALLEFHGFAAGFMYTFGIAIILGRLLHEKGMTKNISKYRVIGMQLTIWPLLLGSGVLLYTWVAHTFIF